MRSVWNTLWRSMRWVWKHVAAGVALTIIVAALWVGYQIGRPHQETPAPIATDSSTPPLGADLTEPHDESEHQQWYTCSMHPTVRLLDPNARCPICFMALIPVVDEVSGGGGPNRIVISADAAAASRVETAKVGRFYPSATVRLFGKVTYDETSVARLTAYFPGRIERLFVNYVGIPVNRGDHLVELYSPELLAAFEELRQVKAAADPAGSASNIVRESNRDTLVAVREKLRLFGLTPTQIAAVEDGSFDSDRLTVYAPIGGVVTHLAVRDGDYVQTGAPIATVADLSRLWLDLEAYESQLPMLRWGQPISFTVEAHPGETFEGQISFIEPIVDSRTRTAAVRVAVDNADRRLKPGMFASAVVRTRVAESGAVGGDELAGKWVGPMHPNIIKDAPGQCDICGMDLVPAETLGGVGVPDKSPPPLVVPRTAVLFTGIRSVVYVQIPDSEKPIYEGRQVVLGPKAGDFYIVREGLAEGESVVVNGAFRLDSAMQIAAKPSMMSPGGGGGASAHAGHAMNDRPTPPPNDESIPEAFVLSLGPVYAAYLAAQESLAADELGGYIEAAQNLNASLGGVEELGLVGESLAVWRRAAADLRVSRPVTTIDEARTRFAGLSQAVIALQRRFGHAGAESWRLAHCPMAFDDKGADWIQRSPEIENPYFGDMMFRCGDIRETFEPIGAEQGPSAPGPGGHDHD